MLKLTINDRQISAVEGQTVLEVALDNGIYIPNLCYAPDLKPYGGCRLCIVEIDGMKGLLTACTTLAAEGMKVRTDSQLLTAARRSILDLMLAEHPLECLTCVKNQRCELQKVAAYLGFTERKLPHSGRIQSIDDSNPFFRLNRNYCILCGRCTRACDEITGNNAIEIVNRGYQSRVGTAADMPLSETNCRSCGECVAHCPVAALIPNEYAEAERQVTTVCSYCGVGCGLKLQIRDDKIIGVEGDHSNPVSKGRLCAKGRFGIKDFVHHKERLTDPLIRNSLDFIQTEWDEALEYVCSKLARYQPGEIAVIASAKATNEDNYVAQKLTRAVLGTNNIDHCARLCHSPTVAGLAAAFGSGAMTNSINDMAKSECFLVIGANTTETHPIIGFELKQAVKSGAKLIVINPVKIPLANSADIFLQPAPGTDVMLLSAICKIIIDQKMYDEAYISHHTDNFTDLVESLRSFELENAARITGISLDKIQEAASLYASAKPAGIFYAMGLTQHSHGTDNVRMVANLALLTGNIGKPGSGVNPLRGQNNVQGACDMGALPDVFPGYQKVIDVASRVEFEKAWGVSLPQQPGLNLTETLDAIDRGEIKALYVIGENIASAGANLNRVRTTLSKLKLLIVQDMFLTETAEMAHVVLPAASFAEKDGTFTNTERRVQRVRFAVPPPGQSRPDWWITTEIGKRLGGKGFNYTGPAQIFNEMRSINPLYAGITYKRLENDGLQWPCPAEDHPGTPILHAAGFNRGKGSFQAVEFRPPVELPDKDYPLILTTGRNTYHFHTGSMTRRVKGLTELQPDEILEISPEDADRLGINNGDTIRISSRRGSVTASARVSSSLKAGVVFMTFHFPETSTNLLTNPATDPIAGIPELKVAAIRLEKAEKAKNR